jgi:hypothetical protein
LVLVPEGHLLASVRSDYWAMENMIFGEMPDFEDILAVLHLMREKRKPRKKFVAFRSNMN